LEGLRGGADFVGDADGDLDGDEDAEEGIEFGEGDMDEGGGGGIDAEVGGVRRSGMEELAEGG